MKKLIILLPLLLCACTKAPEINDLMIISGISVDLTDDGYEVCSEITDVHTSDINEIKPVILKTRGKSVAEAISETAVYNGERPFYSHAKVMIISRDVMEQDGCRRIVEEINRDNRFRASVRLFITEGKASDILSAKTPTEDISAYSLDQQAKESHRALKCFDMPFYKYLNDVLRDDTDAFLPMLTLSEEMPKISGTAVFRNGKLVKTLSEEETQYCILVHEDTKNGIILSGSTVCSVVSSKISGKKLRLDLRLINGEADEIKKRFSELYPDYSLEIKIDKPLKLAEKGEK